MKKNVWLLVAVLCGGVGANALGQVPESERTLVTDPDVLESMGFPRDAKYVYRAKSLDRTPPESPDDWGSNYHYASLAPASFIGRLNTSGVEWHYSTEQGVLTREGGRNVAAAPIDLPTGAEIGAFRWWADDTDAANDLSIYVFEWCQSPFGPGPLDVTVIAVSAPATSGSGGLQSGVLAGGSTTVNNQSCYYEAQLLFQGVAPPGPSLAFQKLRVQWRRQVSPAPAVATFGDVPTSHPFFQFIEALAASGITAGCGGGNYCPDAALTRGQMAVFLSIALGLYFP